MEDAMSDEDVIVIKAFEVCLAPSFLLVYLTFLSKVFDTNKEGTLSTREVKYIFEKIVGLDEQVTISSTCFIKYACDVS